MRNVFFIIPTLVATLLFSCCKKKPSEPMVNASSFDEKALLSNLSTNIILPAYEKASTDVKALQVAINTFTTTPTIVTLADAKAKWNTALFSWQDIALFQIGPANDVALKENVNIYPTDTTLINQNIRSQSYDLQSIANFSAKGLQAVDYLINSASDTEIIVLYTSDLNAANRITYLKDITNDVVQNIESVKMDWKNSYQSTFENATGVNIGSSIGLIVNELNRHYETRVRDGKVGIPSGARTFSKTPLPEKAEAFYDNTISRDLLLQSLVAIEAAYTGQDGQGLDDFLDHVDARYTNSSLNEAISNQFTVVKSLVSDLSPSIADDAVNDQNSLISLFNEMQFLSSLLKVEMTNALEVQITFQDSDGD